LDDYYFYLYVTTLTIYFYICYFWLFFCPRRHWDGGKVGGLPIWLDPTVSHLPDQEALRCKSCSQQMNFLMQIYAPVGGGEDGALMRRAFHRSVYVFCCRNGKCLSQGEKRGGEGGGEMMGDAESGLLVLRCQMEQENEFYESNPVDSADEEEDDDDEEGNDDDGKSKHVGADAGSAGNHSSAQLLADLGKKQAAADKATIGLLHEKKFDEHEIVTEPEEECKERSDADLMASVNNVSSLNVEHGALTGKDAKEAMSMFKNNDDGTTNSLITDFDTNMRKFHVVTSIASDQVLRYSRWDPNGPLWVSNQHTLKTNRVPSCEHCGGPRCFEFQIMPQLLNALRPHEIGGLGEIDWGTLAVYTCAKSCADSVNSYTREYVYRQPID
jgi:pre-rRNA-processing protein TSR4